MLLYFFILIMVLMSIAFFTLLERKILSYIQTRKGPNKVVLLGLLQPAIDGIKLFSKEYYHNFTANKIIFNAGPGLLLFLMFIFWQNYLFNNMNNFSHNMIIILIISSLGVYGVMMSGWASNSKYSVLGAYRNIAQMVSYEVGMIFFLMLFFMMTTSYNLYNLNEKNQNSIYFFMGTSWLFLIWMAILMAELNRNPFDFAESESELVSGFNIEYGGLKFALLFLAEYGNMIFMSYFSTVLFFELSFFLMMQIMIMMVWVRGVLPRFRYDNLMYMSWKIYLPFIILMLMMINIMLSMMTK